jgi:hypothetical protein
MRAALPVFEFIATLPGRAILLLYGGALIGTTRDDARSRLARWMWTAVFWVVFIPFARLFLDSWPAVREAYGVS